MMRNHYVEIRIINIATVIWSALETVTSHRLNRALLIPSGLVGVTFPSYRYKLRTSIKPKYNGRMCLENLIFTSYIFTDQVVSSIKK